MRTLIGQLLDVARLQAGQELTLEVQPTNLGELARQVTDVQTKVQEQVRIRFEAQGPDPVGDWDPDRIERVISNLLYNAVKYNRQGAEVVVSVRQQLDAERNESWAVLEVRDQGMGIPAADLPNIFDRFFRGSNVAGKIGGTGIGLAGVKHIVQQHAGTIHVESTEGVGTVVTVRLPARAPGAADL
jgi:signal transduction histidine kinase